MNKRQACIVQQQLTNPDREGIDRIFDALRPQFLPLMRHVFGNYVIQKMLERGDARQRRLLAESMETHMLSLSVHRHGCHVVQCAIEYLPQESYRSLFAELEGRGLLLSKLICHPYGNYVVQKLIESRPPELVDRLVKHLRGCFQTLAEDHYGYHVVQSCLRHGLPAARRVIIDEILGSGGPLTAHLVGQYVGRPRAGMAEDDWYEEMVVESDLDGFCSETRSVSQATDVAF